MLEIITWVRRGIGRLMLMGLLLQIVSFTASAAGQLNLNDKGPDISLLEENIQSHKRTNAGAAPLEKSNNPAPGLEKMGRHLYRLRAAAAAAALEGRTMNRASLARGNPFIRVNSSRQVQVHLYTEKINQTLLDQLRFAGLEIEIADTNLQQVQGWIGVHQLDQLARLTHVHKLRVPHYGESRRGSVTTAGDAILRADELRARGLTGKGVRIGIISDGANNWTSARASGDLPVTLIRYGSCRTRTADPSRCMGPWTCNEGTAMAEIIYDMAPGATLAVAAASTSLEFIQRVNQLVNNFRADIIVDDLGFYGEPYFEDGEIADAVRAVAGRVLYVSSAGNSADGHYERDYYDYQGTQQLSWHDFGRAEGRSVDYAMGVLVPAKNYLRVLMQWNDPFNAAANNYDLMLVDQQSKIIKGSYYDQSGAGSVPFEDICYYNPKSSDLRLFLVIKKVKGVSKRLELFNLSRSAQEYNHAAGSVFGHPGVPEVLAIGAINASDSGHNSIAYYSSRGPARIDFPSVQNRRKPDLVAIDGVRVTGAGGFSPMFYGTSAAAPHVAAVAALLMSSSPGISPYSVSSALKNSAVDLGSPGFDLTYGHGRVDAVRALALLNKGTTPVGALLLLLLDD